MAMHMREIAIRIFSMRDLGCSEQSSKLFAEKMGRQDIQVCVVSLSKL
jgi:hypothetical protein